MLLNATSALAVAVRRHLCRSPLCVPVYACLGCTLSLASAWTYKQESSSRASCPGMDNPRLDSRGWAERTPWSLSPPEAVALVTSLRNFNAHGKADSLLISVTATFWSNHLLCQFCKKLHCYKEQKLSTIPAFAKALTRQSSDIGSC